MKNKLFALLFLCIAFPAVAAHFPLCMYGVNDPENVPVIKRAGFTCFQTYQKNPEKLASGSSSRQIWFTSIVLSQ